MTIGVTQTASTGAAFAARAPRTAVRSDESLLAEIAGGNRLAMRNLYLRIYATVVVVLMSVAMAMVFMTSARSFAAMANYVDMDASSRNTLDQMTRDVRQAGDLVQFSPTEQLAEVEAAIAAATQA